MTNTSIYMTEIEIKAHVTCPITTESKIRSFADFKSRIKKTDVYWKQAETGLKIRLRREEKYSGDIITQETNLDTIITYKKKTVQEQTEVNDECEFTVSDRTSFEFLLQELNFAVDIEKTKKTVSFSYLYSKNFTVTIELSEVPPLGYFIELEIVSDKTEASVITKAKKALFSTLKLCDIPETDIETRFYTDMIKEISSNKI